VIGGVAIASNYIGNCPTFMLFCDVDTSFNKQRVPILQVLLQSMFPDANPIAPVIE